MFSIHDIIALAIRLEQNGESVYRAALERATDPEIRDLLEWMADAERDHARWFSDLKTVLEKDRDAHIHGEMRRSLTDDYFGDQTFSLKDVDLASMETFEELIRTAIEFERDSILFYEMLAPFIAGKTAAETLQRILEEENLHIRKLKDLLPKIARAAG